MDKLDKYQKIGIISLIIVFSGVFGFVYEYIFYFFNYGCTEFYFQGGNFLPWINIYAIGGLLIYLFTYKLKKSKFVVFLMSMILSGSLEYISGYLILKILNVRYWDYNNEILNFGNINGFICLRSVLIFGISGLFLIYIVVPYLIKLSKKMNRKTFLILSLSLLSIFLIDEIYNSLLTRLFDFKNAIEIYKSIGVKYR